MKPAQRLAFLLVRLVLVLSGTAAIAMSQWGSSQGCNGVVVQTNPGEPLQLRCKTPCLPPLDCYKITSTITLEDGTHAIRVCNCSQTDDDCCKIGIVDFGDPGAYPLATGRCNASNPPGNNCPDGNGCFMDEPDFEEPGPWLWTAYCTWYLP